MKPHPRIRKTIKWGGAAVTALLVVVWIGSGWWTASLGAPGGALIAFSQGEWIVGSIPEREGTPRFGFASSAVSLGSRTRWEKYQLWFDHREWNSNSVYFIPGWFPATMTLAATLGAWRLDSLARRRAETHLCRACRYDRTGILKDAKCPECGSVPA